VKKKQKPGNGNMEKKKSKQTQVKISNIKPTNDILSGRGGLSFFTRYFKRINILNQLTNAFNGLRKSSKGMSIKKIVSQFIYNVVDGTKHTMTRFDELKNDAGYLAVTETRKDESVSSHTMKRFFKAVKENMTTKLQDILLKMFIWRLKIKKPELIIIGADTMVLNNNDAQKREGVSPTYKKIKGYHPVLMYWGRMVINMAFHKGKEHHNTNNDFFNMVRKTIAKIRDEYNPKVPIIIVSDAGFYDQKYFKLADEENFFFICGGKLMDSVKLRIMLQNTDKLNEYEIKDILYEILDFEDKRESWKKAYRALYYRQIDKNEQIYFEFDRPETLIYTNLSDENKLKELGLEKFLNAKEIVSLYQMRARDEIVNRVLKEFVDETLPFKKMLPNKAYYFLSVIANNLMVTFQEDVTYGVVSPMSYPNTLRRLFFDVAAKITSTGHSVFLCFERNLFNHLKLPDIWNKCQNPPVFA